MAGGIDRVVADINDRLASDIEDSGRFVTLFYAELDAGGRQLQWVRAGHEPAQLYDSGADKFEELGGKGMPLGVFRSVDFEKQQRPLAGGQIIMIGTDGIWETRNEQGQMFGKDRLKRLVRALADRPAREMILAVFEAVAGFRGSLRQEDDITLVAVKVPTVSQPPG